MALSSGFPLWEKCTAVSWAHNAGLRIRDFGGQPVGSKALRVSADAVCFASSLEFEIGLHSALRLLFEVSSTPIRIRGGAPRHRLGANHKSRIAFGFEQFAEPGLQIQCFDTGWKAGQPSTVCRERCPVRRGLAAA